ncbi:MAG TPA: hypothetical protein VHD83_00090 [Puia sp.]|nr:hypothetical protein [Puia sp.]
MTSFLLAATLLFSCKHKDKHLDPNKQVDEGAVKGETYVSQDMGWTITIPKGWTVVSRDQTEANEKKGAEAIRKSSHTQIDMSGLKHLISFQKDRFNSLMSTSEPFPNATPDAFDENCAAVDKMIYDAYSSQGIRADTSTSVEMVHGHRFNLFHATLYSKEGKVILQQLLYSKLIRDKDFSVTINYNNEEDKKVMMDAFMNSTLKED